MRELPAMIVLVGELNPHGGHPDNALVDYPPGCSGDRLRRLVLGVPEDVYYGPRFARHNLCRGRWSLPAARQEAAVIVARHERAKFILLGDKVARGFAVKGGERIPPLTIYWNYLTLPHPSGLNRQWQNPAVLPYVRELLAAFIPDIPWGSA